MGNDVSTANITELTQGTEYVFSVVSVENGSRAAAQEIESDDNVTLTSSTFTRCKRTMFLSKSETSSNGAFGRLK